MTKETLEQTAIDLTHFSDADAVFEKIKTFPIVGTQYRGTPVSVEKKEVNRFVAPGGNELYCGPSLHVEDLLKYDDKEFTKENLGSIYFIETSKPNESMVHPVTQVPTHFMYEVQKDGTESLYIDAARQGYAPAFGTSKDSIFKQEKITNNMSLTKVVQAINPQSRII